MIKQAKFSHTYPIKVLLIEQGLISGPPDMQTPQSRGSFRRMTRAYLFQLEEDDKFGVRAWGDFRSRNSWKSWLILGWDILVLLFGGGGLGLIDIDRGGALLIVSLRQDEFRSWHDRRYSDGEWRSRVSNDSSAWTNTCVLLTRILRGRQAARGIVIDHVLV